MIRARAGRLMVLGVLAVVDIGYSLHATLTHPSHPATPPIAGVGALGAGPRVASLGEVLGWMTSFLLLLVITVVIVDAVWVGRHAGETAT